jgi:hypothetical protein
VINCISFTLYIQHFDSINRTQIGILTATLREKGRPIQYNIIFSVLQLAIFYYRTKASAIRIIFIYSFSHIIIPFLVF